MEGMTTIKLVLYVDVSDETAEELAGAPTTWDAIKPVLLDSEPGILVGDFPYAVTTEEVGS